MSYVPFKYLRMQQFQLICIVEGHFANNVHFINLQNKRPLI